jgi:molybdopterin-containing oxidoreductase family iron-sulfur binding subunit
MYKSDEGLTLHAADKCIGCRLCQLACPYGVIYFNQDAPFANFREDGEPAIAEGTATGPDVIARTETPIPDYNPEAGVRAKGIVEKCTFCSHRLAEDKLPWCVESCPADARIFGDLNDPDSPPRQALAKHAPRVLQKDKGTSPRVFYIRDY